MIISFPAITLFKNWNNFSDFQAVWVNAYTKAIIYQSQRKGDIIELLIFINLVLASVYLVAFESLNKLIISFFLFIYIQKNWYIS